MSILLIPSSDHDTFVFQMPIASMVPETHHTSLPESGIAAADLALVIDYSSAQSTSASNEKQRPQQWRQELIEKEVREADWVIAGYLEEANARSDKLLLGGFTDLDWYDSPM